MINNRYNIIHKLGEGRSQVFLCSDTKNSDRKVALKIISGSRSQEEINHFSNEFFILNNFNHPGIIKTYETQMLLDCDDEVEKYNLETGMPFFTLEYFEGKPFFENDVRLDSNKLKSIIKQICSVLFYIHQSNYIYADLKPDNILIDWSKSNPQIKFIDFGFTTNIIDLNNFEPCGSAEYIAPEILMRKKVDHRADLYSFGIMLYQIIYGKLPFECENEIEIYNSQIDKEFSYPENEEYYELIEVTKKLLNKDPNKRYNTSLEVMRDLDINYGDIYRDWLPAKVYIKRSGIHKYLISYLTEDPDGRILVLRGAGNSGKTALLNQISRNQKNILPVLNFKLSDNLAFVKELVEVILNNEYVYNNIDANLRNYLKIQLKDNTSELINRLPVIFSKIASQVSFTILLDDFNLYSQLILEILINLIPRLQINNVRIIIGENSSFESAAKRLSNKLEIKVTPFNDPEVDRFLKFSFNDFYPREDLKKVIMQGSDLFPGNILQYYRDLILLGIVTFEEATPKINLKEKVLEKIRESHNKIYEIRVDKLSPLELKLAEYISIFNNPPELKILSKILELDREELFYLLGKLRGENILRESEDVIGDFTSLGIKEFIYSNCRDTELFHLQAAEVMRGNYPDLYSDELARHFELGGEFYQSYEIVKRQIEAAEQISAINTKKNLLEHLLSYPLERGDLVQIKYSLAAVLSEINDFKGSMVLIEELLKEEDIENEQKDELKILRGKSHIFLGELEEGKEILNQLLDDLNDLSLKQDVLIEIAKTDFDLNDYDKSFAISQEVINSSFATPETRGKAYNLLGLIDIYNKGDYKEAINYLNQAADLYKNENLHVQALGIEINLGNLYHMLEDDVRAEDHWKKAYEMNNIVGDLDKEGKLLINSGIFSYNHANYDDARERYEKATNIFRTIGNRSNLALVLTNLGELFLTLCKYAKAEKYLLESLKLFQELENHEEEAETLLILAKYFYTAGDEKKLKLLLRDYKNNLEVYQLSEKYQIIYNYLFLLVNIESDPINENINKLVSIRETFIEWNERGLVYETTILLCELYLAETNFDKALILLNDELFLKIIENNEIYQAEREYLYGNIASLTEVPGLGSPIEYFENAFQIIKDKNIIELTWKICYGLGLTYFERGIVIKASEYIDYAQNLLFLMAENLELPTMRTHFLSTENRRKALAKLRACKRKTT